MSAVNLAELAVEGSEWPMTGFTRYLDHQTIREANRRSSPELPDGCGHDLRVLHGQVLMIQEHLDRQRDRLGAPFVDGSQYPGGLSEGQVRPLER